ncbi:MAG: response regulator [Ignavibacteria bacterium]|nr:response regulator [Ignavibacteria bacterium]
MKNYKEIVILLTEDDDGHADLIREGLEDSGVCNKIIRFVDGQEIWEFLLKESEKENKGELPNYLLLLDINMPRLNGVEVLRRMKSNEELKKIPVMMLTTTDDPREVEECYKIGCNIYITKPVDFLKFAETLKRLGLFVQVIKI